MCRSQLFTLLTCCHHSLVVIPDDKDHRKMVRKAMQMWSDGTCIKFTRLKDESVKGKTDFVIIKYGEV